MSLDDLCYLGAAEALDLFRRRALSPVELMQAVLARAEATEPVVNALPCRYPEAALAAARDAEARWMRGQARPLEGLPVAIKDSTDLAGQPTSLGSLTTPDTPVTRTAIVNTRVIEAGGIPHARSATPEFSCAYYTHSRRWGVTRNPWHPETAPGGSSGGAAATLAAGSSTLATGSDIAGSIREPAARCAVVGYKPPRGRVPQDPPFNLDPYCHGGPMARGVADAMLMQNVLAGPHPSDPTCLPADEPLVAASGDLKGWRIAWSPDLGAYRVDAAVAETARSALAVFEDLGAEIEEVRLPWSMALIKAGWAHLGLGFGQWIALQADAMGGRMTGYALRIAEQARAEPASSHFASIEAAAEMHAGLAPVMDRCRLLVAPATASQAIPADFDPARHTITVDGLPIDELETAMTIPFNMLSSHPVMSVPAGWAGANSAVGLQLVGRLLEERDLFRAGLSYETAVGGWYRDAAGRPRIDTQGSERRPD